MKISENKREGNCNVDQDKPNQSGQKTKKSKSKRFGLKIIANSQD